MQIVQCEIGNNELGFFLITVMAEDSIQDFTDNGEFLDFLEEQIADWEKDGFDFEACLKATSKSLLAPSMLVSRLNALAGIHAICDFALPRLII